MKNPTTISAVFISLQSVSNALGASILFNAARAGRALRVRDTAIVKKLASSVPILFFGIEKPPRIFGDLSYSRVGPLSRAVMPEFLARQAISRGGQIRRIGLPGEVKSHCPS